MAVVLFVPPLPRMSGGLAVLCQYARHWRDAGCEPVLVSSGDAPGLADMRTAGFAVHSLTDWPFSSRDSFLVPEGWPNAMAPALSAGSRVLVYVQNWAMLLPALPAGAAWNRLPVRFAAVSRPVAWFLEQLLGLPVAGILPPALDPDRFRPLPKPGDRLRIAWMPRKNRGLAEQIIQIIRAMPASSLPGGQQPEWVEIHRRSPEEVARLLGESHLFLTTGFPEGFGLPGLEAMACGALPVGFTGFGGWDYMRQGWADGPAPPVALPEMEWGANGLFAPDGDVLGAVLALQQAMHIIHENGAAYATLLHNGQTAAAAYGLAAQRQAAHSFASLLA